MPESEKRYGVVMDGWVIKVKAKNEKQARHRAYKKFNEKFSREYGPFMSDVSEVYELKWWED